MGLLDSYMQQYVQITIDPRTLFDDINRSGPYCYVGRLTEIDEHFALLSPVSVYRPRAPDCGLPRVTLKEVVQSLKEIEARDSAGNIVELSDHIYDDNEKFPNPAPRVKKLLKDATNHELVPLNTISEVQPYREY